MRPIVSALLAALLFPACSGTTTSSDTSTTGETDAETGGETGAHSLLPTSPTGECAAAEGAPLAGARELLLEGYAYGGLPKGSSVYVFDDEAAFAAFLARTGLSGDPTAVDWATEAVVVAAYRVNSTCGAWLVDWAAWDDAGAPHLEARVADKSFGCQTVCDMAMEVVLAAALPRGSAAPTACLRVGGGCAEEP